MIKFVISPNNNLNFNIIKVDLIKDQKDGKDVWVVNEAAYTRQPDPNATGYYRRTAPYIDVPYGIPREAYLRHGGLDDSLCFDTKDAALLGSEEIMREHIRERIEQQRKEIERIEEDIERLKQLKPKHYMKNKLLKVR